MNVNKEEKIVKKLIAEEFLAWQIYNQYVWSAAPEVVKQISGMLTTIANDEFNDHMAKLVDFALSRGYVVPSTIDEFIKNAGETCVKLYEQKVKKFQHASYYLDLAIAAEADAINSYVIAIESEDISDDLYMLINPIMYEEYEHLADLQTTKFAIECECGPIEIDIN